eukprot:TRINITY_DN27435_c0_g1_i10.p1 TRINITY_DN27435_c0_g1~~TRINITY_DN27435_c0_g1_i10.p1  ORF type:complete len:246 (-),score=10.52 TRINITY_DN27435_c0_g1_i10:570-1244(-)
MSIWLTTSLGVSLVNAVATSSSQDASRLGGLHSYRRKSELRPCSRFHTPEDLRRWRRAQEFEDVDLLRHFFNNRCDGTYLEMGALDGRLFSNSFVFNRKLNWSGVLIEADPVNFNKIAKNRPKEQAVVHGAVCAQRKRVHYMDLPRYNQSGAIAGIWEFASPAFRELYWPGLSAANATMIDCVPLLDLLDSAFGSRRHYILAWAFPLSSVYRELLYELKARAPN